MLKKKIIDNTEKNAQCCEGLFVNGEASLAKDEALLLAYAQGDTNAFEILYSRYKKSLFNHIRRQCSNSSIAEELGHDVWLAVIKQANSFEPKALFKTWLYRIAHNRLVDYWRKNSHSKDVLLDDLFQQQHNISNYNEDQSSELIEIEELLNLLNELSAEQTNTLLLKVEGFSHAEIAQITQTKQETVKSRLRYATKHLRLSVRATS